VHPLVAERVADLQERATGKAIMVYDVPLLAENKLASMYDVVIVVDADDQTRLERLAKYRNMSEEDAKARMAAQATREDRLAIADLVIPNDGSIEDLDAHVDKIWTNLTHRLTS